MPLSEAEILKYAPSFPNQAIPIILRGVANGEISIERAQSLLMEIVDNLENTAWEAAMGEDI
jgi:hypothetical protein